MMRLVPGSVRGRLWTALGLLALAIVCISTLTWIALQRVDARLQDLHQQSLAQVAQAIDLSKRSSDLATSAPYLLNQQSNFLIEQEGEKLLGILKRVREEWPTSATAETDRAALTALTVEMEDGIRDLVVASQSLDRVQAFVRARVADLGTLREDVTLRVEDQASETKERLTWWTLHSMNADALNAAYADNLIGVGEEQRHYQRKSQLASANPMTSSQAEYLNSLTALVLGANGVFELRREELGLTLDAQNALFRIRRDANHINQLATDFAKRAEAVLTEERSTSSSTIQFTRVFVAAISLAALSLALIAALYVSRYVAFNVSRVSEAMVRLANGDRSSVLPRRLGRDDEIGDLFRSFRSFRANALRLDRSNRQLDQRNALFEKVFANIADGIAITDSGGKLTASNPAFERILDVGDLKGSLVDWLYQSAFGSSAKTAGLTVKHRGHLVLKSAKGDVLEIRASRLPDEGRVWLISDVTEQHQVAERVAQIDRIELLGKLAGDTAHDFANILSTIRTHAHLLDETTSETQNVSAIENAVDYGAALTDRLLAFARKQPLSPEVFDLNALLEGMVELVEIGLKPNVRLEVVPANAPLYVRADPGQLESAIFNLVLNSNNAIKTAGVIRIILTKTNDGHAEIVVSDTGSGMPKGIQEKVIQPFFTTRAGDGGTGLGLSIVYGFINQSGGKLDIDSQEDKGTTVTVSLPCVDEDVAGSHLGCAGEALVVDDNDTDRRVAAQAVADIGYRIQTYATAKDALEAAERDDFDLIVSDFDLGGAKDGLDVLRASKQHNGQAQLILTSGKSSVSDLKARDIEFVEKPVTAARLLTILKGDREKV